MVDSNQVLSPEAIKALADHFAKANKKEPLTTPGEYTLQQTLLVRLSGTVKRGEDGTRAPTVSIPWKTVAALILEKCGITGDAVARIACDAVREAMESDKEAIALKCKDVEKAEERVKTEIIDKLARTPVAGRTSCKVEVAISDASEVERVLLS